MPTRTAQPCPRRDAIKALAADDLTEQERSEAEEHLGHCESCRALFRQLTADRFPKFRGYTILAEIDRGGFGIVYKAFHHGKARVEALKVLFGQTALREAYFENEVHLVAKLRHPNIATLYEAHLSTPPLYYAMEFVAGRQLDDYFRSREVVLEERIEIIKTVAGAIEYAHQEGVIHRDLKPQNILIDAHGQAHIVDFGISKKLGLAAEGEAGDEGAAGSPGGLVGTFGYIAPEQLAGQKVDERADVYGLGALLFHVITGQPARFATQVERLTKMFRERRISRADDLAAIIACAVHPEPEQRYPHCMAMVADLDNYLAGREVRARLNPSLGYRVARIATVVLRNHLRPVQVTMTVVLVCLLTLLYWRLDTRWQNIGQTTGKTSLVAFMPSTLAAIRAGRIGGDLPGLTLGNSKSWRLLYGRLLEVLADADPSVVVFDYYFPDCHPEYDAAFIRGIQTLKAPVVVGSKEFDVNGEPVLCPDIRAAVHGWGSLYSKPLKYLPDEVLIPMAVQRGFNPLIPSLAVAGLAASQFPDCDLELSIEGDVLELRYLKRRRAEKEYRYKRQTSEIPIFDITEAEPGDVGLMSGDTLVRSCFPLTNVSDWHRAAIPFEHILTADAEQRRKWFSGRVVLIGKMMPPFDRHKLRSGEEVFGCQVQALLLDAAIANTHTHRLGSVWLTLRVCLWCVLGAILANIIPVRETWSLRGVMIVGAALFAAGITLLLLVPVHVTDRWSSEAVIGVSILLTISGPTLVLKLLHRRQLHLTPGTVWSVEGTTAPTTMLTATPKDHVA
ncbi:MAG: protein kinase [Phycisphaerae bacterium]|nr:protein kinase [Phycisphaerae bacterium]